jgi:hypothetical protein
MQGAVGLPVRARAVHIPLAMAPLLVLFVAELMTLPDLLHWLDWPVLVGVLLVPPALIKSAPCGFVNLRTHRSV